MGITLQRVSVPYHFLSSLYHFFLLCKPHYDIPFECIPGYEREPHQGVSVFCLGLNWG